MPSHDERWGIERYPQEYGDYSYGCPDLDLMGYSSIAELMVDVVIKIRELERKEDD